MSDFERATLVDDLRAVAAGVAGSPSIETVTAECSAGVREYVDTFGSWYEALAAADAAEGLSPPNTDRADLLADLHRLAADGDTVTKNRIAEEGEYRPAAYERLFGSLVIALEQAGVEPTTRQYNFAGVEPPPERAATKNIRHLREHGPTPSSEMPLGSDASDRQHGMWKFVIRAGRSSADAGGGRPEPVYYLDADHDPETVMRAFFEANERLLESKTYHGLIQGVGDHNADWVDIAKEFLPDLVEAASNHDSGDPGVLYVVPDGGTTRDAAASTVTQQTDDAGVISDVDVSEGYVWGLPDDQQAAWKQVDPGDLVFVRLDETLYGFEVTECARDWNATTDIWARYEDGVKVAGPDRPWPHLLVGTTGGVFGTAPDEFETAVSATLDDGPITYLEPDAVSSVLDAGDRWRPVETPVDATAAQAAATEHDETDADSSGEADDVPDVGASATHTTKTEADGGSATERDRTAEAPAETLSIDATVATFATQEGDSFVDEAVSAHLKRSVDGIEPTTTAVTADETAPIAVDFGSNEPLVKALCGPNGTYESPAAFLEDALRVALDLPDEDREVTLTLDGATAALLETRAAAQDTDLTGLLTERARALAAESSPHVTDE